MLTNNPNELDPNNRERTKEKNKCNNNLTVALSKSDYDHVMTIIGERNISASEWLRNLIKYEILCFRGDDNRSDMQLEGSGIRIPMAKLQNMAKEFIKNEHMLKMVAYNSMTVKEFYDKNMHTLEQFFIEKNNQYQKSPQRTNYEKRLISSRPAIVATIAETTYFDKRSNKFQDAIYVRVSSGDADILICKKIIKSDESNYEFGESKEYQNDYAGFERDYPQPVF